MGADQEVTITAYEMTLIRVKARKLVGTFGFTESDREDIEQDLAVHLIERIDQLDLTRSSRNTFVNCIVDRKIISMLRWRFAQRRDYRRCRVLLGRQSGRQP